MTNNKIQAVISKSLLIKSLIMSLDYELQNLNEYGDLPIHLDQSDLSRNIFDIKNNLESLITLSDIYDTEIGKYSYNILISDFQDILDCYYPEDEDTSNTVENLIGVKR
jgi:hypothetical protein